MEQAARTPLLRRKLRQIVAAEDLIEGSHDYKATVAVFESFPSDELFQAGRASCAPRSSAVLQADEAHIVAVVERLDATGRGVSVLVAHAARPLQLGGARGACRSCCSTRFGGETVDYHLSLGETERARILLHGAQPAGALPDVAPESSSSEVSRRLPHVGRRLAERLVAEHGEGSGVELAGATRALPRLLQDRDHIPTSRVLHVEPARARARRRAVRRRAAERAGAADARGR